MDAHWKMITASPAVTVMAYWKGTGIQYSLKGADLLTIVKASHAMLVGLLREGDTLPQACDLLKSQVDELESLMVVAQAGGCVGMEQDKFLKRAWKNQEYDVKNLKSLWLSNILALLKARAIEDDENFGIQLHFKKNGTLIQYTTLPPLK